MNYSDFQQSSLNEYLASSSIYYDLMKKTYELLEKTQELYNSSWGWLGANLAED